MRRMRMPCSLRTFSASSKMIGRIFARSLMTSSHMSRSIALVRPAPSHSRA